MPRSHFTIDDVRRINQSVITGKFRDRAGLSPVSQRILREAQFSAEDIQRAFAEAAAQLAKR